MAGALPGPATARALRDTAIARELPAASRVWVIALGKAAHAMTAAAVACLADVGIEPAGGVVVSVEEARAAHDFLIAMRGDHPVPGPRSRRAADFVEEIVRSVGARDLALVLISGGTTSLVGAPVADIGAGDLAVLNAMLLGSGLDIVAMNAIRKRFSRWGGGRLAAALAPARVVCLAISDVVGDDPSSIGSGPCSPDVLTAADVQSLIDQAGLSSRLPDACRRYLDEAVRGKRPETPKSADKTFARVTTRVIAGGSIALEAAAARARSLGLDVRAQDEPLSGEASEAGRAIARALIAVGHEDDVATTRCVLWRGETTVRLDERAEPGGRCQELALAAARVLAGSGVRTTLLAAGTDGRDGPTDAAGACVDESTWRAISERGIDPADALAHHASHRALDAVGALIRTGPTGTNVGDVVIGIV